MIKLENVVLPSPEQMAFVIQGLRNPFNSWDMSDSETCKGRSSICDNCHYNPSDDYAPCYIADKSKGKVYVVGTNDLTLMKKLSKAGTDHRKYMRMIPVMVRITAPLYWWKEADTYKVGTVSNSCSTMHKIHEKEFNREDFSYEHLDCEESCYTTDTGDSFMDWSETSLSIMDIVIGALNHWRNRYIEIDNKIKNKEFVNNEELLSLNKAKKGYWWQMIQLLPSSYNQTRNVMLNYEVLANIYHSRKGHKLDEWHQFCEWIETLPYSEIIVGAKK